MSSRRSFLDADKSIMERNLRFVKNDLEENLSHYFGGSSGRDNNSPHYSAPPRDYKVVQPNPEADLNERASLNEVEKRRRFLLQLGFTRHVAYDLAKCANISIDRLHQNYNEYLDRGFSQDEILERISCGIRNPMNCLDNSHLEQDMLRKTPSPPPPPKISLYCGDQTNLHYDSRSYSDREDLLQSHFRETSRNQPSEITYFSNNSFDVCHEINSDKSLPHNEYNSKSDNMFSDIQPSTSKASMENSSHMSSRECGSAVSWLNESFSATQLRNVKKKDDNMNSSCQIEVFNASIQIPKEFSNTEALISSLEYNSTREKRSFAENLNKKPDQEHLNSLHWVYDYLAEAESKSTYDIGEPSRKDIGKLRVAANTVRKLSKNSAKGLDEIDLKQLTWAKNFLGSWQVYLRELKSKSVEDRFHIKSKLPAEKPVKYCSTNSFVEDAPLIRAIIDRNDPDGAISVDNWNIVVNHLIREFRKIVMDNPGTLIQCSDAGWHSQGLVRLVSCPNELSVVYLEQTVRAIKGLRKTVILDVVNIEKIPRRPRVTAIVLCEPSDRNEILQLLQLGNPDIPTQDWKIVSVGAPKKSFRRITVIVNEQSLGILLKKRCKMYYGFESIRLSVSRNTIEVTEGSTGLGDNISNFVCQDDSWEPVNQSAYEKAYLNTDREDGCVLNTFKEDICKGGSHAHAQSNDLEDRRGFLLQLGLARHDAYEVAKRCDFDVKKLEKMYRDYFARGYRQDEVMTKILSDLRNEKNWVDVVVIEEQAASRTTQPVPIIAKDLYDQRSFGHLVYNRSDRSRSRSYDGFKTDRPSEFHRDDEYLPQRGYTRDDTRKETLFEQHKPSLIPARDLSPMHRRRGDEYLSKQSNLRDEPVRANVHKERSRSYSPEKFDRSEHLVWKERSPVLSENFSSRRHSPFRREVRYLSSRSRSPNGRINEDLRPFTHSPTKTYRKEGYVRLSRSRSPYRKMKDDYRSHSQERNIERNNFSNLQNKWSNSKLESKRVTRFGAETRMDSIDDFSRANTSSTLNRNQNFQRSSTDRSPEEFYSQHAETRMETSTLYRKPNFQRSSRDRSPEEFYSQHDNLNRRNWQEQRSRDYSSSENNPTPYSQNIPSLLTLNVFPEDKQQFEENSRTRIISSSHKLEERSYNPRQHSREERSEELYSRHEHFQRKEYEHHSSRDNAYPRNNPTPYDRNIPSLLELHVFPKKNKQYGVDQQNFNTSTRTSSLVLNGRIQNFPQPSREKSSEELYLQRDNLKNTRNVSEQLRSRDNSEIIKTPISREANLPFPPSLNVYTQQQGSNKNTISKKPILYSSILNAQTLRNYTQKKQTNISKKTNVHSNNDTNLIKNIADIPLIHSGLGKPLPGFLKPNPRDYWSKWWPHFKYIEYSIPKINPDDNELKSCLHYLLNPNTAQGCIYKLTLIEKANTIIMKTKDVDETNYYTQDIFKLFQYKLHLEDPNFQNSLTPAELNCIAPALRQFQIRSVMCFMHQALIAKWHLSLDIMRKVQTGQPIKSNYAKNLLNNKSFHYLVKVSIQELKKMCQADWPEFTEFYKSIKAKKVDIYSFGVGPPRGKHIL